MVAVTTRRVLIADDDDKVRFALKYLLEAEGFDISCVNTVEALMTLLKSQSFDCLLLDMNFELDTTSGQEGLAIIKQIRTFDELLPVVMLTGWASVELAVSALKLGANDFLQKPWDDQRLLMTIASHIKQADTQQQLRCLSEENQLLKAQSQGQPFVQSHSPVMQTCLNQLAQLAKSDMNILLTGENGSGKSLLANYVHRHSSRADGRFVAVNMGAISESLFESEMFGHVKGAFTDAKQARVGRFELAIGGTLFLDEIANIAPAQQAKLLRVLEEAQFERVGSSKTLHSDARIISATNADLKQHIADGGFRQDLYYRLNTVSVYIPSLRERVEDILPLAEYFLTQACHKYQKLKPKLSESAKAQLLAYAWPGNVRELSHLMERVLFSVTGMTIEAADLGLQSAQLQSVGACGALPTLDELEKQALIERLAHFKGNASKTAQSLGLSRSGWYRRVDKFDL